jgi:hypothetical protein
LKYKKNNENEIGESLEVDVGDEEDDFDDESSDVDFDSLVIASSTKIFLSLYLLYLCIC